MRKRIGILAALWALTLAGGSRIAYADNGNGNGNGNYNGNGNNQGQNQQGNNPFHQKTDSGDDASVLPTPDVLLGPGGARASFAPKTTGGKATVFPAPYGSGNLINHGGPEIPTASFYAVFWNSSVANSTQTSLGYSSISSQIQAFVLAFGGSANNYSGAPTDDFNVIQQYGKSNSIKSTLPLVGMMTDSQANASSISDSSIRTWLKGLFAAHRLTPNANTIYGLYFPPGMKVQINAFEASCTYFCGYHSSFSYNGVTVKYAVFPYLNCAGCSISGLSVGDMLTIVSSHEIRESVSDPLGNAWYDSQGNEADDKCVWHNLYQMASGGFWVQPEYSNGGTVTASGFTTTYPGPGCVRP